ncbi:hypothetical protein BGZ49_004051, partial [Haplosporangium sp. Z 27]
ALRRFFKGAHIPDEQRTLHAIVFLVGNASLWWDGMGLPYDTPFDEFERVFKAQFISSGSLDQVGGLLFDIKFESTLSVYVGQVRKCLHILCSSADMSTDARQKLENTVRAFFLQGCPEDLRRMLLSIEIGQSEPSSLQTLLNAAERFDKLYNFTPNGFPDPSKPFTHAPAQSDPMVMEIDSLRLQFNAVTLALQNQAPPRFPPKNNYRPPPARLFTQYQRQHNQLQPLSPEERAYLMSIKGCFRCRQPGHIMRDCSKSASLYHMFHPDGTPLTNWERPSAIRRSPEPCGCQTTIFPSGQGK